MKDKRHFNETSRALNSTSGTADLVLCFQVALRLVTADMGFLNGPQLDLKVYHRPADGFKSHQMHYYSSTFRHEQ